MPIDRRPELCRRVSGVVGLRQEADDDEMTSPRGRECRDGLGSDSSGDEDGSLGVRRREGDVLRARPGPSGFCRRGSHRSCRDIVDGFAPAGLELLRGVGGEAHDGPGTQDATGQSGRGVLLPEVDTVSTDI